MATFEKGILGGFSGKVGNVVGSRWRGKNVMRSLPQRGKYTPSTKQEEQRVKFATVIKFLTPIANILSQYFGSPQGDKSRTNLATSYHLKNAVVSTPEGMAMDYAKVMVSKGDLRGLDGATATAAAGRIINLNWQDNSGQGKATATDALLVVIYAPQVGLYFSGTNVATRDATSASITLAPSMLGFDVEIWAGFYKPDTNFAANSTYLGTVTVV